MVCLKGIVTEGSNVKVLKGVPRGSKVVGFGEEAGRKCDFLCFEKRIYIDIEHESFDDIVNGGDVPELECQMEGVLEF